jgi:predicted Fe-S protein YdhL (DUF1289 family)
VADKQIACLAHEQSCAGCASEGDAEINWPSPNDTAVVFLFDTHAAMHVFAQSGFCQSCQRKAN